MDETDRLAEALRAEFNDTELHSLVLIAGHPNNRDSGPLQRIRQAAIRAANCDDCRATR